MLMAAPPAGQPGGQWTPVSPAGGQAQQACLLHTADAAQPQNRHPALPGVTANLERAVSGPAARPRGVLRGLILPVIS